MKKLFLISILTICYLTNYSQEMGTFIDTRDGKAYKTVKLGTQTWFAENLAYEAGSGCWAYDNKRSNVAKYGYLYNWETANSVCPGGWHLPSDAEWTSLTNYLGGENVAGGKLKATTDWSSPNTGATNESGFSAIAGGARSCSGDEFSNVGNRGYWWISNTDDASGARELDLVYNYANAGRGSGNKEYGYSVRCARD